MYIKPCPRCGYESPIIQHTKDYLLIDLEIKVRVHCPKCGIHSTPAYALVDTVDNWNSLVGKRNEEGKII